MRRTHFLREALLWCVAALLAFSFAVVAMTEQPLAIQPPSASRVCVAGVTGMGKSHWVRAYVRDVRRLLVWDPERDWSGEHGLGGGRITLDELVDRTKAGRFDAGVLRVAVRPRWRGPLKDEHEIFCRCARRIGALTTVHEEVSNVGSPNSVGLEFNRLIVSGRHRGVSMVMVGQRYAQFPRVATGNASLLVTFRQTENADVEYLRERLGDLADRVKSLPERHYVTWTPLGGARLNQPLFAA